MQLKKLERAFANAKRMTLAFAILTLSLQVFAQTAAVTGTVLDEQGKPIAGATVLVKGTSLGTTTDESGRFSIRVAATGTLVISNIGYNSVERSVSNQQDLTII